MNRVHCVISGDVQGVGFRSWVREKALELGLTGWVKNREDGAVEVVAEGQEEKLEELIEACHRGPEVAWIERVGVTREEAAGEFVGFEVVY